MCVWAFHRANINIIFYDMERDGAPYCGVSVDTAKCKSCVDNWKATYDIPNGNGRLAFIAWIKHMHFEPIFLHCKKTCDSPVSLRDTGVHQRGDGMWVLQFSGEMQRSALKAYHSGSCARSEFTQVAKNQSPAAGALIDAKNTLRDQLIAGKAFDAFSIAVASYHPKRRKKAKKARNQRRLV